MLSSYLESHFRAADRQRSINHYRRLAARYDRRTTRIEQIRHAAIAGLRLVPGDRVLDVACGTGQSLPKLIDCVGRPGRVVGVEQCPEMAAAARRRLGPGPHRVVTLPVEEFRTHERFDAILLSFTHDVLQNPAAVMRVFEHARPGARIAVAGLRFLPWWGTPVNLVNAYRARHYVTTLRGMRQPWRPLLAHCPDLRVVRTWYAGSCYLALGRLAGTG